MSERLVTSFRLPEGLYQRWRTLANQKGWSMRERLIEMLSEDLRTHGAEVPVTAPKKGWWELLPAISGKALKEAREAAGMSQTALARELRLYPSTISRYEAGRTKYINLPTLELICSVLGVSQESLLEKHVTPTPSA